MVSYRHKSNGYPVYYKTNPRNVEVGGLNAIMKFVQNDNGSANVEIRIALESTTLVYKSLGGTNTVV